MQTGYEKKGQHKVKRFKLHEADTLRKREAKKRDQYRQRQREAKQGASYE